MFKTINGLACSELKSGTEVNRLIKNLVGKRDITRLFAEKIFDFKQYIVRSSLIHGPELYIVSKPNSSFKTCIGVYGKELRFVTDADAILLNPDSSELFSDLTKLKSIDLTYFNSEDLIDGSKMFYNCINLEKINLSNINPLHMKYANEMFMNCKSLKKLDLSNFETLDLEQTAYMFSNCDSLTHLDLSTFSTTKVVTMQSMFENCTNLRELEIEAIETPSLKNSKNMFSGCESITYLDLRNFNFKNIVDMSAMFKNCINLRSVEWTPCRSYLCRSAVDLYKNCCALNRLNIDFTFANRCNVIGMLSGCNGLKTLDISELTCNKGMLIQIMQDVVLKFNLDHLVLNLDQQLIWRKLTYNLLSNVNGVNVEFRNTCRGY